MDEIPSHMRRAMSHTPFLLSLQQSRGDDNSAASASAYALRTAPDIVLVDDANAHMLFCDHLFVAPHDDVLEPMYASLGAPLLSSLVSESFEIAGQVLSDTPHTQEVRRIVLERTPLFFFEKRAMASKEIHRDITWLLSLIHI